MEFLKNIAIGITLGVSNIIPGVSAGTIAVIIGIYDKLLYCIANIKKEFKKSILFLLPIIIGIATGIFLFAKLIDFLLANYSHATLMFFVGIILGSIPMIYHRSTETDFKARNLVPFFVALAVVLSTFIFNPTEVTDVNLENEMHFFNMIFLFFCGTLASGTMIIPGISGSFLMLVIGKYNVILSAVAEFCLPILIMFGAGAVVGIVLVAKIISYLLKKHPQATYFGILGFVLGSVPAVFPGIAQSLSANIIGIVAMIIGIVISYIFSKYKTEDQNL